MYNSAEFQGAQQIGDAGKALFEDDQLACAVVRGVLVGDVGFVSGQTVVTEEVSVAALYRDIPELHDLDQVVVAWWQNYPVKGFAFNPILGHTLKATGATPEHFDRPVKVDGSVEGPLTFSLRVDNAAKNKIRRTFLCKPVGEYLLGDGFIKTGRLRELERTLEFKDFVAVQQNPGDMVLFRNFPVPTIHGVRSSSSSTVAVVASYRLQSTRTTGSLLASN